MFLTFRMLHSGQHELHAFAIWTLLLHFRCNTPWRRSIQRYLWKSLGLSMGIDYLRPTETGRDLKNTLKIRCVINCLTLYPFPATSGVNNYVFSFCNILALLSRVGMRTTKWYEDCKTNKMSSPLRVNLTKQCSESKKIWDERGEKVASVTGESISPSHCRVMPTSFPCDKRHQYPIRRSRSCKKIVWNKVVIIKCNLYKTSTSKGLAKHFNLSMAVWFCRSRF